MGELADHHLFSGPRGDSDVVADQLELRKKKRDFASRQADDAVLFFEKQRLKRLEKRSIPPRQEAKGDSMAAGRAIAPADATLYQKKVMEAMSISDPIFHEQWHLYNTIEIGHDVNVTGLWFEGASPSCKT